MAGILYWTVVFAVSLLILLKASQYFTTYAERIGLDLGIPPFIIGITIVAFGTSMPELVSSVFAVVGGASEIVIGNVVGSNIANIFLILGAAAVGSHGIRIDRDLVRVDLPLLVASAFFLVLAVWDGAFMLFEGLVFLGGLLVYVHFTISEKEGADGELVEEVVEDVEELGVGALDYAALVVSLAFVSLGAMYTVDAVIRISELLAVGTELVAMTAVAVGTSLPELSVSLVAARKGSQEIAVGNILGSNIFNTFAVMGGASLVGTLAVPLSVTSFALPVMVGATLLYFFITQDREITEWEGAVLLLLYVLFLGMLVQGL